MKYPNVSKRFKYILNLRGLTAQELADKSSVGKSSISHYVNGTHCPSNQRAMLLAEVLHCNPLWLMDLDSEMVRNAKEPTGSADSLAQEHEINLSLLPDELRSLILELIASVQEEPQNAERSQAVLQKISRILNP